MNYKISTLCLLSVVGLSGCFSLPTSEVDEKETNIDAVAVSEVADQIPPATPEETIVEQLVTQTNLYEINKKALTSTQRDYMIKAVTALQLNEVAEGIGSVAAAESLGPLSSAAYVVKSDLLKANEKSEASKEALEQALQVNPYNPKAANRLATLLREEGEFEAALDYYTQAIKAVPMYAPSYRNRGVLNDLYLLDKASALADYETYSALLQHENKAAPSKDVEKTIRLVKRWIVDVDRQLQRLVRNADAN